MPALRCEGLKRKTRRERWRSTAWDGPINGSEDFVGESCKVAKGKAHTLAFVMPCPPICCLGPP